MKFEKKEPEVLENFYLKQKKLPEKARQFVIKLVEKWTELLIILKGTLPYWSVCSTRRRGRSC